MQSRVEAIRRLARKSAGTALRRTLEKSRPEDIAAAIEHLAPAEQRHLFAQIEDDQHRADALVQLDLRDLANIVHGLEFPLLIRLLERMEADDAANLIARLPEDLQPRVLAAIRGEEKEQVEDLLAWPPDSAGRIMQPVAFRVNENNTCREAIEALQRAENIEMVFYLYAENDAGQLVGVTSLRNLLTHPPSTRTADIMTPDVIAVTPETDQEEVARLVSRYGLLAVPVVDESRRLLGIVTVDDVVDVIKEEAAEDMMLMAGMSENAESVAVGPIRSARQRLPWLLVTVTGGVVISEIIGRAQPLLSSQAALVGFIPVMMGMGGNVGIQAATIAVRNLATGTTETTGMGALLFRELRVGLLIGLGFAVLVGTYAGLRYAEFQLGLAIGASATIQLGASAAFGSLVPMLMDRMGIDPAVATGPFVTTGIDLLAVALYLGTCLAILGLAG